MLNEFLRHSAEGVSEKTHRRTSGEIPEGIPVHISVVISGVIPVEPPEKC